MPGTRSCRTVTVSLPENYHDGHPGAVANLSLIAVMVVIF